MEIRHRFNCGITDDPAAVSAGKVVPSHWNDTLAMTISAGQRIVARLSGAGEAEEATLSQILDFIGSAAWGDILFRGTAGWQRLGTGTVGQVLTSGGAGADLAWGTVVAQPFTDGSALVKNAGDPTKQAILSAASISTATTRTYTLQDRNGILADDTDLALKADLASPALTGNPTAPTQSAGTNNTRLATTAFVQTAIGKAPKCIAEISGSSTLVYGFNVASVTGNIASTVTINFTNAMSGTSYFVSAVTLVNGVAGQDQNVQSITKNTTSVVITGNSFVTGLSVIIYE